MPNIVFEHLKEHINFIKRKQIMTKKYRFNVNTHIKRKQIMTKKYQFNVNALKEFEKFIASFFQVAIHFYLCHLKQQ